MLTARKGYDASGLLALLPEDGPAYDGFAKMVDACFGVVSDEVFGFLVRTATEVRVVDGMLNDETDDDSQRKFDESIPSDAVFYVPIAALGTQTTQQKSLKLFSESVGSHLRIGTGEHIGRGWARTRVLTAKE